MALLHGLVENVETRPARSFATADAAISDTVVYVADASEFYTSSGTCTIEVDGLEYSAVPTVDDSDDHNDYLTVDPALTVAVLELAPVTLVPAAEVKWAFVSFTDDEEQDLLKCRVPKSLTAYKSLDDGVRNGDDRESVQIETEPEPHVVDPPNDVSAFNATTTPIVVTTDDGERVFIDGDGFTAYTDDPALVRLIQGNAGRVATDGTYVYTSDTVTGDIRKFDASTGVEQGGGFPVAGTFTHIAVGGGYIFAVDVNSDIAKYNASTGASVGGGFPIAGTFGYLSTDGTYVYARDVNSDIAKYNASTGASVGGGFPIAGTFSGLATDGSHIYAVDASFDIRKYATSNGVEDTSGFPISVVGNFAYLAVSGGALYATANFDLYKYDAATGVQNTSGFPITDGALGYVAADSTYLYVGDSIGSIRILNGTTNFPSIQLDSSRGSGDIRQLTTGELTSETIATKTLTAEGPAYLPSLEVYSTRWLRTTNQSISDSTGTTVTLPDSTDGSTSGLYWSYSAGTVTIAAAGVYRVEGYIEYASNATGYRRLAINLNGTRYAGVSVAPALTSITRLAVSATIACVAGDALVLNANQAQSPAASLNVQGAHLQVTRIGALAA